MDYFSLKSLHMACAAASGTFFLVRGAWMLAGSPLLQQRLVRTVPHVIDTLLLASAVWLAAWSGQYPFAQPWLTGKVLALLAYIVLGAIALKYGRSKAQRTLALVLALACFGYIAATAATKNPFFLVS